MCGITLNITKVKKISPRVSLTLEKFQGFQEMARSRCGKRESFIVYEGKYGFKAKYASKANILSSAEKLPRVEGANKMDIVVGNNTQIRMQLRLQRYINSHFLSKNMDNYQAILAEIRSITLTCTDQEGKYGKNIAFSEYQFLGRYSELNRV